MRTMRQRMFWVPLSVAAVACMLAAWGCVGGARAPGACREMAMCPVVSPAVATLDAEGETTAHNTEAYDAITENTFLAARRYPLSTFSIDVDTASYANVRRMLLGGRMPPPGAVRIEEMVNYFRYDYPQPEETAPFSVNVDVAQCPWTPDHRLARIGLAGRRLQEGRRPPCNLVFLLDVSGSMNDPRKLPLLRNAMKMLVERLGEADRVSIVVYAGAAGLVLPPTSCDNEARIMEALDGLRAGGSTAGGAGITLAYQVAEQSLIAAGTNRVILCTDGDFNVGVSDRSSLVRLIEEKAKGGVFLTVLGFGMGNYKDSTLEQLADHGNGNYAYIDTIREARKVLVEEMGATLVTIAKDVKIQVDFNPATVRAYRLIGYENRILAAEDFRDDSKDAGEIGAGHTVTALYEIVPAGTAWRDRPVDSPRYVTPPAATHESDDLFTVKLRYKEPTGTKSILIEQPVRDGGLRFGDTSRDFRFAAAVAAFGMVLRGSKFGGNASYDLVLELAREAAGQTPGGYRDEFLSLVRKAKEMGG